MGRGREPERNGLVQTEGRGGDEERRRWWRRTAVRSGSAGGERRERARWDAKNRQADRRCSCVADAGEVGGGGGGGTRLRGGGEDGEDDRGEEDDVCLRSDEREQGAGEGDIQHNEGGGDVMWCGGC